MTRDGLHPVLDPVAATVVTSNIQDWIIEVPGVAGTLLCVLELLYDENDTVQHRAGLRELIGKGCQTFIAIGSVGIACACTGTSASFGGIVSCDLCDDQSNECRARVIESCRLVLRSLVKLKSIFHASTLIVDDTGKNCNLGFNLGGRGLDGAIAAGKLSVRGLG